MGCVSCVETIALIMCVCEREGGGVHACINTYMSCVIFSYGLFVDCIVVLQSVYELSSNRPKYFWPPARSLASRVAGKMCSNERPYERNQGAYWCHVRCFSYLPFSMTIIVTRKPDAKSNFFLVLFMLPPKIKWLSNTETVSEWKCRLGEMMQHKLWTVIWNRGEHFQQTSQIGKRGQNST